MWALFSITHLCLFVLRRHAIRPPSTSQPSIQTVDITPEIRYLLVMSDGVYKSIEAAVDEAQTIGANQVLANMVHACFETPGVTFNSLAQTVLDKVARLHEEAFQRGSGENLTEREDMTLAVCKFNFKVSPQSAAFELSPATQNIIGQFLCRVTI